MNEFDIGPSTRHFPAWKSTRSLLVVIARAAFVTTLPWFSSVSGRWVFLNRCGEENPFPPR